MNNTDTNKSRVASCEAGKTAIASQDCEDKKEWRHFQTGETKEEFLKRITGNGTLVIIPLPSDLEVSR